MEKIRKFITLFAICFVGLFTLNAHAQQAESVGGAIRFNAVIEDTKQFKNQGISFLEWDDQVILVETIGDQNKTLLHGHVTNKIKQLFFNGREIKVDENGGFEVKHEFRTDTKTFNLRVVGADTKSYFNQYRIKATNAANETIRKSLFRFSAGAGLTVLSYRQQAVTPFSEMAMTIKGSASYPLIKDQIDIGISGFYNVFGFASTSPRGYKMRYMGLNARVGYSVIKAPSAFRLNLNVGVYYNTSFSDIGFGNMMGPQLYPELSYIFSNGHSLHAYGKFSPALSSDYSISFSDNRELAAGLHYSFPITPVNRLTIGLDLSQLMLSVAPNWGATNTYSLSGGVSF
jgi:hypothetical protein